MAAKKKSAPKKVAPKKAAAPVVAMRGPKIGAKAPDFNMPTAGGGSVQLSKLKGKNVIVYFYPKDDTPGCTKEACGFRDAWKDLQKLGAIVLGVSPDGGVSHQRFATKYQLPFPLLSDPLKAVMEKYGAWGEKLMYGKKVIGVIRSTVWIGRDGVVRKHWKRVAKAEDHPEEVLAALRAA